MEQLPCQTCIYNNGKKCFRNFKSAVTCRSHKSYWDAIDNYRMNTNGEETHDDYGSPHVIVGQTSYGILCENIEQYFNQLHYEKLSYSEREKMRIHQPEIWNRYDSNAKKEDKLLQRRKEIEAYHRRWEEA